MNACLRNIFHPASLSVKIIRISYKRIKICIIDPLKNLNLNIINIKIAYDGELMLIRFR